MRSRVALKRTGSTLDRIGRSAAARPGSRRAAMERIPILKMGDFCWSRIQVDMHDRLAMHAAGRPHRRGSRRSARAAC